MEKLKAVRMRKKLTQQEVADAAGISLRSYQSYEKDPNRENSIKYKYLMQILEKLKPLDEEHGVLEIAEIQRICKEIFREYPVDYGYLFGSYAKGNAAETSDVDLLVGTDLTGLRFFELTERLREGLHKRVDVLNPKQLLNNEALLHEVLKEGIRIYVSSEE